MKKNSISLIIASALIILCTVAVTAVTGNLGNRQTQNKANTYAKITTIATSRVGRTTKYNNTTIRTTTKYYSNEHKSGIFTYCINSDKNTATIIDVDESASGSIVVPSEFDGIVVNTIDDYAFNCCKNILTISIPNSVINISDSAFRECSGLISIDIPNSVTSIGDYAFYKCDSLQSVKIPDSVKNIGDCAFNGCKALKTVNLGNNANLRINYNTFDYCDSLESFSIGDDNIHYCTDEFGVLYNKEKTGLIKYPSANKQTEYTISATTAYINEHAFENSKNLEKVNFPLNMISIGSYSFRNCTALKVAYIQDGVTTIGDSAFSGCSGLTSIAIPKSVTSIGDYILAGCSNIESITIPYLNSGNSYSYSLNCLFNYDDVYYHNNSVPVSLKSVAITNAISIPSHAFYGCGEIESITLNEGITSIGDSAFSECSGLSSIDIPDSVTSIGSSAFIGCSGLTSIDIPNSVTSIGDYAFYKCDSLQSVIIPDSVENIGDCAFNSCKSLQTVNLGNSKNLQINYNTFDYCDSLKSFSIGDDNIHYCTDESGVLYNKDKTGLIKYPSANELTEYTISADTAYINEHAFENSKNLQTVNFPENMMSVGTYAFRNCTALKEINIPAGADTICNSAFADCTSVSKITLPESLKNLGRYAFANCIHLSEIVYNCEELNSDEYNWLPFSGCGTESKSLEVYFTDTVRIIPKYLLFNDNHYEYIETSESSTPIEYCSPTEITFGTNIVSVGIEAFRGCNRLTTINFNAKNCSFDNLAFCDCTSLENINISNGVERIPDTFIQGCTAVTEVVIPQSVKSIGNYAFSGCDNLENVRFLGTGEISVGNNIFMNSYKAMICCKENSYMHSYADINGLKVNVLDEDGNPNFEVKNNVLIKYKGNAQDVFVSSASKIGYGAYCGNSALKTVELSNGVDRIYDKAFADCTGLEKIVIPQNVSAIGDDSFSGCDKLTIYCYSGSYAERYAINHDIPIEYITLKITENKLDLALDKSVQLCASFSTLLNEDDSLIWTSDNPSVATVTPDGKITAVGVGTANITATSKSGLSATCIIKVADVNAKKVNSVSINDITLNYKASAKITPNIDADDGAEYTVSYSSSNANVSVDENGNIYGAYKGSATITCTVTDSNGNTVTDTCNVTVKYSFIQWIIKIILFGWLWY